MTAVKCSKTGFLPFLSVIVVLLPWATAFSATHTHRFSRGTELSSITPQHPAVQGWPEKYSGSVEEEGGRGPRILHESFTVEKATEFTKYQLDVVNWPTWSTAKNPKWVVGKQNIDKVMPYGELSYVLSGKLEIISPSGERVVIEEGDFVTFPEGFKSSWRVLEELTWHYYLF